MDAILNKLLDKASKKQIIAIVSMVIIMLTEVPAELTKLTICLYLAKIISITVVSVFALTYQWSIDIKEKNYEKENLNVSDSG